MTEISHLRHTKPDSNEKSRKNSEKTMLRLRKFGSRRGNTTKSEQKTPFIHSV